jgi:hypothetical protein
VDGVHHFSKISRLRRTLFDCCLRHVFSILTCCNIYENVAEPKGLKLPLLLCLCIDIASHFSIITSHVT